MKYTKRNWLVGFWLNDNYNTTIGRMSLAEITATILVPTLVVVSIVALLTL